MREKGRAVLARVVNVAEVDSDNLSCALPGTPEPLRMSFIPSLFFHQLSLSHWYSYSSLAALIILSLAYSRFRGLFGQDNKNMSLTVKWGRERFVHFIPLVAPDTPRPSRAPFHPSPHTPDRLLIHTYTQPPDSPSTTRYQTRRSPTDSFRAHSPCP
jgi:hypothetical protein